ncbi:S-adenosyl-L-methionine-dependent methyltransferase [Bombardia bombarda]|uniref:S-adenosyl-L-methionine-dependent methyltransferase n=1 Tax=Bombardia bombarda TaxID=252184 RepID=A0AA39WUZ6_9PEZI|nr:S-adenosyl-L-methionine-dependent methyltransferase [Bombardia bombarda]
MATSSFDSTRPIIDDNRMLESYYMSLESRIGYKLLLGGTRHFGYYKPGTYWPFPIGRALRAMEAKLFDDLNLPEGSQVIDAGCGVGHVAIYMARRGLRVTAFDFVENHVKWARQNIAAARLPPKQVTVQRMDYHHLESIPDESHDGVYTCETFVHANDPEAVLAGFYRILRPGSRVAMHEYDNELEAPKEVPRAFEDMATVNYYAAMPTNARSHPGFYKQILEDAGFEDVVVQDLSANIRPMLRLFFVFAFIPYFFIKLFHLEWLFPNTVAGAQGYLYQKHWRYLAISATKPGPPIERAKTE